jgi:DNA ligase (NAD+)
MKCWRFWCGWWIATIGGSLAAGTDEPQGLISALRAEIARHDELYHRRGTPEISDAAYDALKRRLAELERLHPAAAGKAPPLREIADDRTGLFATVQHRERMLSLEKAYSEAELRAFDARVRRATGENAVTYVIEPKYDGLAVSLTYVNGKLQRAVTRGDGREGDDVTSNVLRVASVPRELTIASDTAAPEWVEIRGELYVPFAEFARVNAEREAAGERTFANPRNLAAGTVRQLDADVVAHRGLAAVFYAIGGCEPAAERPPSQQAWLALLEAWGVPTPTGIRVATGIEALARGVAALRGERESWSFPTDGVVIKVDALASQRALGEGESAPRWALAYKFPTEQAETVVREITIQVGRTGVLTPVAELRPVALGGSTITRATLHNWDELARKDVRVGDTVVLEKAGEIIPAIVSVRREKRPVDAVAFDVPVKCPECRGDVEGRVGEVAVRCVNAACPAQLRRRIEHYASKACVDIEGLGPAIIDALVKQGWVKSVPDLYRLRRADLITLGNNSERTVDRLLTAIERSRTAELWRVIHGLGVPGIGSVTAKELSRRHGTLEAVAGAEPRLRDAALALLAVGVKPSTSAALPGGNLAGKVVVLTGSMSSLTRAEAAAKIEAAGGRVASNVTRATNYLVVGTGPGAKLEQARKLGIPVIDEVELVRLLGSR